MSKPSQISLDFGPEPQSTPAPTENGAGNDPARQYMSAAGVGVRIKSYKPTPASATGDLFGGTAPESPVIGETTEPQPESAPQPEPAPPPVLNHQVMPEPALPAVVNRPVMPEPVPPPIVDQLVPPPVVDEPVSPALVAEPAKRTIPKKSIPDPKPSKRGRKSLKQVSAEADLIEIPVDEVLFSKQYYTMGEVSVMFRVNQSLLRFWETEFDILQPKKNKKGDRYFRPVDIKNLHLIYHLLRQKKYTIEGAKDFLKKNKKADERFEVIQRLQQIKAFLLEMKAQL
jgi:DNA-binding transcriptional MerR regulator